MCMRILKSRHQQVALTVYRKVDIPLSITLPFREGIGVGFHNPSILNDYLAIEDFLPLHHGENFRVV